MSAPMMDIMRSVGRRATNDLRESTLAARDAAEGSFDKVLDNVRETRQSQSPARRSQSERRDAEYDSEKRESRRDDDTEANGLHVAQPTEQERVQARLGTSRLTKAAVLGQSTSQDTRATRRFLGNRLALGANTAGSAKGSRAHTRSASEGDLRNGAFGEQTTDAQDESVRKTRDGSTASNIRAGQDSKTEEAKTAARTEKSEQIQMMRKQLRTKMADFASKSMQKVEGAPGKSSLPAPAPTPPAVQAAMRKPTTSADELDTQPTETKLATIVSDARGAAVETVDGTTTLRTTPVTQAEAPAPVPERIVQHIERVMAQSQRQMTISMGELGEVRISMQRLAMQNGGLQVVLEATDARTSQLLQSQLGQLNEALQQKGYSEAVIDVREADAESTGFNENQDDRAQDDAQEEQERREAELAARQRMAKSARNTTREGVVR